MDEEGKSVKEIADELGVEITEKEIVMQPTDFPSNVIWWGTKAIESKPEGYEVLSSWPQVVVEEDDVDEVNKFFRNMGCKHDVHIVGCVKTLPDYEHRHHENPETGGRVDFMFYFHNDDIYRIAVRRLQHGIRWFEDVIGNCIGRMEENGLMLEQESIHPVGLLVATGYDPKQTIIGDGEE